MRGRPEDPKETERIEREKRTADSWNGNETICGSCGKPVWLGHQCEKPKQWWCPTHGGWIDQGKDCIAGCKEPGSVQNYWVEACADKKKPYTCTEVTVDCKLHGYRVRLWIGTDGLVDMIKATAVAFAAKLVMENCPINLDVDPKDIIEYARENIRLLNAVQVKFSMIDSVDFGVMAYTQPFEDNDEERFRV